ncbi:unnamed protein product [marine sediment metagenome]|uniref:Uncharacterized protein n=1 Tax=marine sediment metagenome TaxID=412755 RepID=X1LDC4_9ZZZZ
MPYPSQTWNREHRCEARTLHSTDRKSACTPEEALKKIDEGYVLGYHKAAKIAEIKLWAEMYGVSDLPDELARSLFITPFPSLQEALDHALDVKGNDAKVLFLLDGTMTVPISD